MSTENTAPAWYDGSTPWAALTPAQKLYEAVSAGDSTDRDAAAAGFRWQPYPVNVKHSAMHEISAYGIAPTATATTTSWPPPSSG